MDTKLLIIIIAAILLATFVVSQATGPDKPKPLTLKEVGFYHETWLNETSGKYTLTIHSNYKYYPEKGGEYFGEWEAINESFGTTNCQPSTSIVQYDYCPTKKNLYRVYFKDEIGKEKLIAFDIDNDSLFLEFSGMRFNGKEIVLSTQKAVVFNNQITFTAESDKIWATYTYLPTKLKEEIFIADPEIQSEKFKGMDVTFKTASSASKALVSKEFSVCDKFNCSYFTASSINGNITLHIPYQPWFKDAVLPLVIDPQIQLNDSEIAWNGMVYRQQSIPFMFMRTDNPPTTIDIGTNVRAGVVLANSHYRGDMDWNLTFFNSMSDIEQIDIIDSDIFLYIVQEGSTDNTDLNISITQMQGNSTTYDDTDGNNNRTANYGFWEDMQNNTDSEPYVLFDAVGLAGPINFDLGEKANYDIKARLSNKTYSFSIGFHNHEEVRPAGLPQWVFEQFGSRDNADTSKRPHLNITFIINDCIPTGNEDWTVNKTCFFERERIDVCPFNLLIYENGTVILNEDTNITASQVIQPIDANTTRWIITGGRFIEGSC